MYSNILVGTRSYQVDEIHIILVLIDKFYSLNYY